MSLVGLVGVGRVLHGEIRWSWCIGLVWVVVVLVELRVVVVEGCDGGL